MKSKGTYEQPSHKLTMIPGPIEFSDLVLEAMSTPSQAHTSPEFVKTFQSVLQNLRKVFKSTEVGCQPYVLSGSGTLGWDIVGANLINPGDKVLVLSTGYFSDSFAECLKVYGAEVDIITAEIGDVVPLEKITERLKKEKYAAVTATHVDTSTSIISDVEAISKTVKKESPETLMIVDGVCSIGVEDLQFDEWRIDFALTASQKAIGVPAGLSIFFASERAVEISLKREKDCSFFASLKRWTPIMKAYENGCPAYFATPAVQTIISLNVSLQEILQYSLEEVYSVHRRASEKFKDQLEILGIKILPLNREVAAHGLTAAYFPKDVNGQDFINSLASKGFTVAGGIHKELVGKYFRVGHMGFSVYEGHLLKLATAIEETLRELGCKTK